jgi:hypothetical protein
LLGLSMSASTARLAMAAVQASVPSCAHCGKQGGKGVELKKCSRCKQASYCGAECQNAGWKRHKKTCEPPVPLSDVFDKLMAAQAARDWRGVLKWEGRMEELMEGRGLMASDLEDARCDYILWVFSKAHGHEKDNFLREKEISTASRDHALSIIRLQKRRVELLGKPSVERFRDQGEALCTIGDNVLFLKRTKEAEG